MLKKGLSSRKSKKSSPNTELESFTLAQAIEEARTSTVEESSVDESSSPLNKIFSIPSPLRKKATTQSAQSLATSDSYNTPNQSAQNTPAVSFFDPTNDEQIDQILQNREATLSPVNKEQEPEVTMSATTVKKTPTPAAAPVVATKAAPAKDEPHFDVTQHIYGGIKDIWAWGKTVPIVDKFLGITEAVAAKIINAAFHTDLPAIDQDVAKPNLKKLDDQVVTPAILAVWGFIEPAVSKGGEMIVEPVMKEVVPKVLGMVGKKDPDASPNPEYTSAPMVN
ncbi:hypothetical protein ACHAWO_006039 [Cyclotella atomus]|jgi:hypothetical protein|uniref:Uncharacterized protein n=1 Tax=Cyclotella atomus TaxID=382360 RepID=A0ABD3PVY5_9STRA